MPRVRRDAFDHGNPLGRRQRAAKPFPEGLGGGCSALRVRGCAGRGRQRAEPPRASRGSAAQREPGVAPSDPGASEVGGKPAAPGKVFKANRKGVANRSLTGATRRCAPLPVTPRRVFTKCLPGVRRSPSVFSEGRCHCAFGSLAPATLQAHLGPRKNNSGKGREINQPSGFALVGVLRPNGTKPLLDPGKKLSGSPGGAQVADTVMNCKHLMMSGVVRAPENPNRNRNINLIPNPNLNPNLIHILSPYPIT